MGGASRVRRLVPEALLALATLTLAGVMLLTLSSGPAEAATTFTVNKDGDAGDRNIDGVCDTSKKKGEQCTLRAAIEEANATPGANTIEFDISGPKTIKPDSPLPAITDTVTIDGYTQPGARPNTLAEGDDAVLKIELDGSNAGADRDGLVINASNSTIKGLVIKRFGGDGIEITGVNNQVQGNFIGTSAGGTTDKGNGLRGVFVSADSNTVGGSQPDMRNVISGNDQSGVSLHGASNQVQGNYIGTDAGGTGALGNT
jgi:CSLREA domain-containing protein